MQRGVARTGQEGQPARIEVEPFGATSWGEPVERYLFTSHSGLRAAVITYGAALQMLECPDAQGRIEDVVPGFADAAAYEAQRARFGAVIGRAAGRVRCGEAVLRGRGFSSSATPGSTTCTAGRAGSTAGSGGPACGGTRSSCGWTTRRAEATPAISRSSSATGCAAGR